MIACKDCAYVDKRINGILCRHKELAKQMPDYYNGILVMTYPTVDYARTLGECGPDAKLFMSELEDFN